MYGQSPLIFLFSSLFGIVPIGILVLAIVALLGGRGDPDPKGKRPYSIYLFGVIYLSLFTIVIASFLAITSLTGLAFDSDDDAGSRHRMSSSSSPFSSPSESIEVSPPPPVTMMEGEMAPPYEGGENGQFGEGPDQGQYDSGYDDSENYSESYDESGDYYEGEGDPEDEAVRMVVSAAIVILAAGLLLAFHLRRARDLLAQPDFPGSAAWRTYVAYLYLALFTAILPGIIFVGMGLYGAFQAIAPGIASSSGIGERNEGFELLLNSAMFGAISFLVVLVHWRRSKTARGEEPVPPKPSEPATQS